MKEVNGKKDETIALCSSCDRCRSRKTKCDGQRPCGSCATKYMKAHKVSSIEGVDLAAFECIYSPQKRRGPTPGSKGNNTSRRSGANKTTSAPAAAVSSATWNGATAAANGSTGATALQQQLGSFLQQQQQSLNSSTASSSSQPQQLQPMAAAGCQVIRPHPQDDSSSSRRVKRKVLPPQDGFVPRTVANHLHLLERNDPEGERLHACYLLSVDDMFRLPPTPSNMAYSALLKQQQQTNGTGVPGLIPGPHLAALNAARFAEIALGALVHDAYNVAFELCNAVVQCLRESAAAVMEHQPSSLVRQQIVFEVAKAFFLLATFRACRGDMERYFKYRRVCLAHLSKLQDDERTYTLLAAMGYLDSWAYMVYNGNDKILPSSGALVVSTTGSNNGATNDKSVRSIAVDPGNQHWIQGGPPIYLKPDAPPRARSLDAIACAVRISCDQANARFTPGTVGGETTADSAASANALSPTAAAVLAQEEELCSRNIIMSAYRLMQQHEEKGNGKHRSEGQHMVISAIDAFLESPHDGEGQAGFTDSQIQSLLSVCNSALANSYLLHHAGPTYHIVTNAAILLCHLLNGMHAMKFDGSNFGKMEETLFEEVLDTFIPIRKLLTLHRRKLPLRLRCHGIPRPPVGAPKEGGAPFIDLNETMLCICRGCQGFVMMGCSPCVAAERAADDDYQAGGGGGGGAGAAYPQLMAAMLGNDDDMPSAAAAAAATTTDDDDDVLGGAASSSSMDQFTGEASPDLDLDDDALLGMISNLISN